MIVSATHTQIDSLLGLTALGSAAMLGEVVAVGVAALAVENVAIFSTQVLHGMHTQKLRYCACIIYTEQLHNN